METKNFFSLLFYCLIASSSFAQWTNLGNTGHQTKMYGNEYGYKVSGTVLNQPPGGFKAVVLKTFDDWVTIDTVVILLPKLGCCQVHDLHFTNPNNGIIVYNETLTMKAKYLKNSTWLTINNVGGFQHKSNYLFFDSLLINGHSFNDLITPSYILIKKYNTNGITQGHTFGSQLLKFINTDLSEDGNVYALMYNSQTLYRDLYVSRDTGKTFQNLFTNSTVSYNHVEFYDSLNGFLKTDSGAIYHSNDGGYNWSYQSTPTTNTNVLKIKNDSTLFIGGNSGKVYISEDHGRTWRVDTIPNAGDINNLFLVDSINVYAIDVTGILFKNTIITGISKRLNESKKLHLFPNPAQNQLHFNLKNAQEFQYQVLDLNGRVVQEGRLEPNALNISTLEQGIFFLQLSNAEEVFSSKFIKQ